MTSSNAPAPSTDGQSRKQRRAAERASRKSGSPTASSSRSSAPSLLVIGVVALVVGLMAVLVLVAASGGFGGSQQQMAAVTMPDVPAPAVALREGRSLGDPEAPVKIDVFEDPQCPACGLYTKRIEPLLIAGPVTDGQVFLTYKDLPFIGPESLDAALAMRAAEALDGRFWDYHGIVFHNQHGENQGAFTRDRLAQMAVLAGLDREAFLEKLKDPALESAVQSESGEAAALGLRSTPSILINGTLLTGGVPTWDQLSGLIDDEAAKVAAGITPPPAASLAPVVSAVPAATPAGPQPTAAAT